MESREGTAIANEGTRVRQPNFDLLEYHIGQLIPPPIPHLWSRLSGADSVFPPGRAVIADRPDVQNRVIVHWNDQMLTKYKVPLYRNRFTPQPLLGLLEDSFYCFESTDVRDKLFALFSLAAETQADNRQTACLVPDYSKSAIEVFCQITKWCIAYYNNLDILSLVQPRLMRKPQVSSLTNISKQEYPSWCLRPYPNLAVNRRVVGRISRKPANNFNLATSLRLARLVPNEECDLSILSLKGIKICYVRSAMPFVLTHNMVHRGCYGRRLELRADLQQKVGPTSLLVSALPLLWEALFCRSQYKGTSLDHPTTTHVLDRQANLQLTGEDSRYHKRPVSMFNDLLETLLMANETERDGNLLWDDQVFARKLACHWKARDPDMNWLPSSVREVLYPQAQPHETDTVYEESLDFSMPETYGLCFCVTDDNRMSLCPADTEDGDLIVSLFGGSVPYVIREDSSERSPPDGTMRFEFVGECYLHGCMRSPFLEDMIKDGAEIQNFCLV